jgi:calcium-dependent protein kinase
VFQLPPGANLSSLGCRRYLLKLRAEVETMKQLGSSLNAVYLRDVYEDDTSVHMVMELCTGGALLDRVQKQTYSEAYISGGLGCCCRC